MKTNQASKKRLISPLRSTIAALLLLPCLAQAGTDITGTNYVPGPFSAAVGYANNVPGSVCFVAGQTIFAQGSYNTGLGFNSVINADATACLAAGGAHTLSGKFNSAFGIFNSSGTNAFASLAFGQSNSVAGATSFVGGLSNVSTAAQSSFLYGRFCSDDGKSGSVMFSDSNPGNVRTAVNLFKSPAVDTFSALFENGFNFRTQTGNTSEGLFVTSSGGVGIGTTAPTRGKVEIVGGGGIYPGPGWSYTSNGTGFAFGVGNYSGVSLYCTSVVVALGFNAVSDARIKRIQGRSDAERDLSSLLAIEVTDYTYIDGVKNALGKQKKVIAQQVENVFPLAVSRTIDVVPDIYEKATVKDGWVQLATDLKTGERVRLLGTDEEGIHEVLEVEKGRFRTGFQPAEGKVFVYGREVKDFRTVDYDAISMLNVSATQELARKLEAKDAEIAKLNGRLAALEARDQAREARRLARLEAAASPKAARAVPAVLEINASSR